MLGTMNSCPHCGGKSSFMPEEMECDKALVLWCKECGNYISQTMTLETIRRWWLRVDEGEESIEPPLTRAQWLELTYLEERLNNEKPNNMLDKIEIHIKDFAEYHYTDEEEGENSERQAKESS